MRRLTSVASAIVGLLLLDAAPGSEISICNGFAVRIYVALAFQDQGNFTAAGWWSVDPNKCEPADFSFQGATLYYAADSDQYKQGSGMAQEHWGNKTNLYVSTQKFNFDNAESNRSNTKGEMFSSIELTAQQQTTPVTITFHFVPGNTTTSVAIKN
jgi:uncharacterized membrane protein